MSAIPHAALDVQLPLTPGPLPKLRSRHAVRSGFTQRASLDPDNQTRITPASLAPVDHARVPDLADFAPPGYSLDVPRACPADLQFRHAGWWFRRLKIKAAMARCSLPPRRRERFDNCGGGAWVERHEDGNLRVISFNCGDRLCAACGAARSARMSAALQAQIEGKEVRFVTLSTAHVQMPLADQITRIYQSFSNLRRHKLWRERVTGGAAFLEIKLSARTGKWHVHLHCLVEGRYLPQRELSNAWLTATGDSYIVDVRAVPSSADVSRYVTKYVTKPIDATVYEDTNKLDEAVMALRGRRLCLTFGSWRGVQLAPDRAPEAGWTALERLDSVRERAARGDADAVKMLDVIANNRKWEAERAAAPPSG